MRIEKITGEALGKGARFVSDHLFAMPATDLVQAERSAELMSRRSGVDGLILIVHDTLAEGFVALCNRAFRRSEGVCFGYVAQDAFAGRLWLALAQTTMARSGKAMLAFNDGKWHGRLASFGLVKRSWAISNYAADLFYAGYQRHYADAELTLLARAADQLCYAPHSVLLEVDWDKDQKPVHGPDLRLFRARARGRFEGRVASDEDCRIRPLGTAPRR